MDRRRLLSGLAASAATLGLAPGAPAAVPRPVTPDLTPPLDDRTRFVDWMVQNRGEDRNFLGQRFDRFQRMLANRDLWNNRNARAYLLTPREEFVPAANRARTYEGHYLDIGFGVTITGPNTVGRMTNTIDPQWGDRVLEIGTGSGYQSAYLSYLTDQVFTVEIIAPLYGRTGAVYDGLIARGYGEYRAIRRKSDDGYFGWKEHAPFDRIIVTCGIDHVPPPLLQQLKPGGIMVIPIGPPNAQHVLKIVKQQAADGSFSVARSDIYHGSVVNFVPFTRLTDQRTGSAN